MTGGGRIGIRKKWPKWIPDRARLRRGGSGMTNCETAGLAGMTVRFTFFFIFGQRKAKIGRRGGRPYGKLWE